MNDPDTISADYTLRPSELAATLALLVEARQPCVPVGCPQAPQKAPSRSRSRPTQAGTMSTSARYCSTPWTCAASPGATAPTGPAGRRRPSCRVGRSRPLAHQPRRAAVGPALGPGRPLSAGARPQGRRIRASRGRIAHRLRQPRERPRRRPPHADAIGVPLRPSRNQGRRRRLARLGGRQWNRRRGDVLRLHAPGAVEQLRSPIRDARLPVPAHGSSQAASCSAGTASTRRSNARSSGAPSRGRGGRVLGLPQGVAASCPIRGPSSTIRKTPSCRTTPAR